LPQYEKTAEKSKASEAFTMIKTLKESADIYFLANGKYPTNWTDLDVKLPSSIAKGGGLDDSMVNANFEYRIFGAIAGTRLGGVAI
jgi:hypothetical protein